MSYADLIKAAEWLGKEHDVIKIKKLNELEEDKTFFVTVWGHYSAGKSRLINNILEREILPVQTRETTAVLTYIYFGIEEQCKIVYEDNTVESYDISILKRMFQNTDEFEKVSEIDHIEVYIDNELLKTGLVLVDTPGVNTVIQKHQDLAVDAIEQSGRIVYVLGNSPSNVDRQFIQQIAACGVRISFVRTKCDRFNDEEENAELSLKEEENELMSFIGMQTEYIPVSNEKGNKWFENIRSVQILLREISCKISEELTQAGKERKAVFAQQYFQELKNEENHMKNLISGNDKTIKAEIEKYQKELDMLQQMADSTEKRVKSKVLQAKKESSKEIDDCIEKRNEKFSRLLEKIGQASGEIEEIKTEYSNHIEETVREFQDILNWHFDEIVSEETNDIANCLLDEISVGAIPTYAEVQQTNSRILEMYSNRLIETRERLQNIIEQRRQNEQSLTELSSEFNDQDYDEALLQLDQQLSEIPSGMALRLSENQEVQPSQIFRAVGSAADLALLLLPGEVIFAGVKAAANTTKIASGLHKMGKAGETLLQVGSKVGKSANLIDGVRDKAYALNMIFGSRRYSSRKEKAVANKLVNMAAEQAQSAFETYKTKKRSGNVLDALSVAYWTEKIGEQFDHPPKMEIDVEEEELRRQSRKRIYDEQNRLSEERIRRKKELGLLQNKDYELKVMQQEEEEKEKRIKEELIKQQEIDCRQAQENALYRYKMEYSQYYKSAITQLGNAMIEQYFKCANQNLVMYAASQNAEVVKVIENKKAQMSELENLKGKENGELEDRLAQCRQLMKSLETGK